MKNQKVKLKNLYNGSVVITDDYNDIQEINEMKFIRVYEEANPNRKFLANRESFQKLTK